MGWRWLLPAVVLAGACSNQAPDWNSLASARIHALLPDVQVKVVDARTLEATLGSRTQRIDTAELQLLCNRGPKDCDYAFDQAVLQLRSPVTSPAQK